jgi:hypothetical protein
MPIYSNVEQALRERKCKCGNTIPKGIFCFRIEGYQTSQNICPDCMEEYAKKVVEGNHA